MASSRLALLAVPVCASIGVLVASSPLNNKGRTTHASALVAATVATAPQEAILPEASLFHALGETGASDASASSSLPSPAAPVAPQIETSGLRQAIDAYRAGDPTAGDAAAAAITDPMLRATAEWAGGRIAPRLGPLLAFLTRRPNWPANGARRRIEEALYSDKAPALIVRAFFAVAPPSTPLGRLAFARSLRDAGQGDAAAALVRAVGREADLPASIEAATRRDFGDLLSKADYKFRSDRLFYAENEAASLRAAAAAGPDVLALAKAREGLNAPLLAAVPAALKNDPTLVFARAKKARHEEKIAEAAALVLAAPHDAALIVDGDAWWVERRLLARRLVDLGDAQSAYRVAADYGSASHEQSIEAEFHAGWIALRFLNDPARAARHFATLVALAETPMSKARANYWRARAADAAGQAVAAQGFYAQAAVHPTTYYGQLARARLDEAGSLVRAPAPAAPGDARAEVVRAIETLIAANEKELAAPLIAEAARTLPDETQLAALAAVCASAHDARLTLTVGKIAGQRGFALDAAAFPTFGVPAYASLARSADASIVYAIARQESAFETKALSGAGAKGLMQMMPATARRTAERAGVAYSDARLMADAAFNAQLGAAHLGELIAQQRGSLILTFAAYNAGGRRVKEWIDAYGDPRDPAVDAIDWVERIPFTETRNYVQRVSENLAVYRALFDASPAVSVPMQNAAHEAQAKL